MKTEKEIRKDLKEIRFYYVNYDMFRKAANVVGENRVVCLASKYNEAMKLTPANKLYVCLYLNGGTLKSVSYDLGYSRVYIEKSHKKLQEYLYQYFNKDGGSEISPSLF